MSNKPTQLPPVIIILGTTAVGKTAFSLDLAERLNGEIISADSRLFYRGMDIGTAKPTLAEQARVKHHLIDIANPDEVWSLGKFKRETRKIIADIHARGKLPFVVGGTGQYVRALTEGWDVPESPANEPLRTALTNWVAEIGKEGLHQRLAQLDPVAAEKIDYRNLRRTVRALEVIFSTGKRFSEQRTRVDLSYRTLQLGLIRPRQALYQRIDQRIEQMLAAGLVAEVQGLLDQGYSAELRCFSAIGYQEILTFLKGEITLEEAIVLLKRNTRTFVRRQTNWFKPHDENIKWFEVGETTFNDLEQAIHEFIA